MTEHLPPAELGKRAAAARALEFVEDGMKLGLGTGSTAKWFVDLLAQRIRAEGLTVTGIPTSSRTRAQAEGLRRSNGPTTNSAPSRTAVS